MPTFLSQLRMLSGAKMRIRSSSNETKKRLEPGSP